MKNTSPALYEFITLLLENMSKRNYQLVVFKNEKSYNSVNSDVTYLNVFAEGIINLLEHLLIQTAGEIILNVHYARRLNVAEKDKHGIYMSLEEDFYLERIEEIIDWRMLRLKSSERARITKNFFPLISANNFEMEGIFFDTHFQRLTIATHEGNTLEEQREIEIYQNVLPKLPATCEMLDYFLKYKLRETEYLKNIYDFEGAITELNHLEKILSSTIELLKIIDELASFAKNIRSTTLGKVIGSRAAAKIYLSKTKSHLIHSAREDSDIAIEQFTAESDKLRQFQMRSMLETQAENFQESLLWLGKAFNVNEKPTPDKVLTAIKNFNGAKNFGLLHFANLMAAAMVSEKCLGREMFDAWISQNAEEILNDTAYPVPVILWRSGKCRALQGSKTAKKLYEDAAKLLLEKPENFTLFSEGLLVEADRFVILEKGDNLRFLKKIQMDYQRFSALPLPPSMRKAFAEWEKIDDVAKKPSPEKLKTFSQSLLKKIPVI